MGCQPENSKRFDASILRSTVQTLMQKNQGLFDELWKDYRNRYHF
jgi:hypothetical protein